MRLLLHFQQSPWRRPTTSIRTWRHWSELWCLPRELRLGEPYGLERKLMVAKDIFQQYLRDGRQIEYMDLSMPERVAVRAG